MGISGLMSYCMRSKDAWCQYVDIFQVSKDRGGIEILVDYYAFQHFIMDKFWDGLIKCSGNNILQYLGGEYGALDLFLSKLVKDLKSHGIQLVVFVDGAKGSSVVGTQQKMETWKSRHFTDLHKLSLVIKNLQGKQGCDKLREDELNIRPVLLEIQIFSTLKALNVEMVFRSGEADFVLASHLQSRPKAFAILTNDSDFCLFENCCFIPVSQFDIDNNLKLGTSENWLSEDPAQIRCGLMLSRDIVNFLGLSNVQQLIDLGIVLGNDFTSSFVKQLKYELGIRGSGGQALESGLNWIKQCGCLENSDVVGKMMQRNRHFEEAVQRSRQFYTLTLPSDEQKFKGKTSQMINDGVERGQFPSSLLSMHHNFYWYRIMLEECGSGLPSSEEALYTLRSFIYRIVLLPREKTVVEYGRTAWTDFSSAGVFATNNPRIPQLDHIDPQKVFQNLRTLNTILLHQEFDKYRGGTGLFDHQGHVINFFDRYGRRNGFLCLLLRYFLVMNWEYNLNLCLEEWLAILALVFTKVDEPWYCGLQLDPSLRGITILNWFQNLYRHAYHFLGSLLHLKHEFPEPKEVVSGAVFCAFYSLCTRQMPPNFPPEWLDRIKNDFNFIIGEKRHMIKSLLNGYITFDTNFRSFFR